MQPIVTSWNNVSFTRDTHWCSSLIWSKLGESCFRVIWRTIIYCILRSNGCEWDLIRCKTYNRTCIVSTFEFINRSDKVELFFELTYHTFCVDCQNNYGGSYYTAISIWQASVILFSKRNVGITIVIEAVTVVAAVAPRLTGDTAATKGPGTFLNGLKKAW